VPAADERFGDVGSMVSPAGIVREAFATPCPTLGEWFATEWVDTRRRLETPLGKFHAARGSPATALTATSRRIGWPPNGHQDVLAGAGLAPQRQQCAAPWWPPGEADRPGPGPSRAVSRWPDPVRA